jgi:hypothetical protein
MESYITTLKNEQKNPVIVFEKWGPMLSLLPGNSKVIEADSADGMYAPWERVVWLASGEVRLVPRSGYKPPELGRWTINCLNLHGNSAEHRIIGGQSVLLPRGIPRTFEVPLLDPLVRFKTLTIKQVPLESPSWKYHLYAHVDYELRDILEDRSKAELEEIERLIAEQAQERPDA